MFQFQADDEEEDREQCVRGPDTKAEFEAQGRDPDFVVDQADVSVAPWRIDPDQCDRGSDDQQDAAYGLVPQVRQDPAALAQRRSGQNVVLLHDPRLSASAGRHDS